MRQDIGIIWQPKTISLCQSKDCLGNGEGCSCCGAYCYSDGSNASVRNTS